MRRWSWERAGVLRAASSDQTARETTNPDMSVPKNCIGHPPATLGSTKYDLSHCSSKAGVQPRTGSVVDLSLRLLDYITNGVKQILKRLFVFFFAHERNERGLAESVDGMESPDKSFWISSFASPIDIAIIGQALWDNLRNR